MFLGILLAITRTLMRRSFTWNNLFLGIADTQRQSNAPVFILEWAFYLLFFFFYVS